MRTKKAIILSVVFLLCLIQLNASGQSKSSPSDTLSYEQAIDGIIKLDADLCACEEKLRLEQEISGKYKKQADDCLQSANVAKKKVFWGRVKGGLKTFGVGAVAGFIVAILWI